MTIFADNVRIRRTYLGLTRRELAERSGFIEQYLSTTERAKRLPRLNNAILLAKGLDIPTSLLLTDKRTDLLVARSVECEWPSPTQVANNLKKARDDLGLTLDDMARITNLGASHISMFEQGHRSPTIFSILAFSDGALIPLNSLIDVVRI